jgi:hypothetical protein
MGRHSTHDQSEFLRSAFMWFLPWLLAAVVGIGAVWIAIDAAFGGNGESPSEDPPNRAAAADASPTPEEPPSVMASPGPEKSEQPEKKPDEEKKKKKDDELISKGVPIQVLNGTSSFDAGERTADELEGLGFEIVAINPWLTTPETVVYWASPNDEKAATLLADKYGWEAQPKPEELSSEVRLHVLIGADEVNP